MIMVFILIIYYSKKDPLVRNGTHVILFLLNFFLSLFFFIFLDEIFIIFKSETTFQNVSLLVLLLIVTYILTIEIPGYIIISIYDEKLLKIYNKLISSLFNLKLSKKDVLDELKSIIDNSKNLLIKNNLALNDMLQYIIPILERRKISENEFNLLNYQLIMAIEKRKNMSKHPFPKLIDILSLTGISFILAQLIAHLS